jgi:hypothetical protein
MQSSNPQALQKYPTTAQTLIKLCRQAKEDKIAALMEAALTNKPQPTGLLKQGMREQIEKLQQSANTPNSAGIAAALIGFAKSAFANPETENDLELSLVWDTVEEILLDHIAPFASSIPFDWGPKERKRRLRIAKTAKVMMRETAPQMLQDFFTDPQAHVLARFDEWDIKKEGAPKEVIAIPVSHKPGSKALAAKTIEHLSQYPAAAQLLAVYRAVNGADLFQVDVNDWESAGFILLPDTMWHQARDEAIEWLTSVDYQDEPQQMPKWVRSAIAFGKIPGDASVWLLPIEGSLAGKVLLSNEDVPTHEARYESFDAFIAALRHQSETVLGCGGYVRYNPPSDAFASEADQRLWQDAPLFPAGYQSGRASN